MTDNPLSLARRDRLPEALQVLLADYPRAGWRAHPQFGPLTQFWLDRHLSFRTLLAQLTRDTQGRIDGTLDPDRHAARLAQGGSRFLQELHGHHSIEDGVYFPKMVALVPALDRAFALLDADHHELHDALEGFATDANGLLRGELEAGRFLDRLDGMTRFLDRHLTDEEEVIVPVILKVGERRLG
ncbi:hemerythrin domain-containing protein [Jannaschia sp. M317]|uniref:hemerythrin domain-containing protein n=1 Tax=Jannaschia sp. M317 TaxID=2867011 RepID=UPI0021A4B9AA|nr:hemerythrin domain-containing protein [Jannaschia sp. M317]UWQ18453.1 hemerythrin domain-containing protein [Jannaschia sp. M317]